MAANISGILRPLWPPLHDPPWWLLIVIPSPFTSADSVARSGRRAQRRGGARDGGDERLRDAAPRRLPYLDKPIVYFASEAAVMEVSGRPRSPRGCRHFSSRSPRGVPVVVRATRVGSDRRSCRDRFSRHSAGSRILANGDFRRRAGALHHDGTTFFYLACEEARANGPRSRGSPSARRDHERPVAIALPLLVAIPYAIWRKRFRALCRWADWRSSSLRSRLCVGDLARHPRFLHYVLVTETAQRLATKALKRTDHRGTSSRISRRRAAMVHRSLGSPPIDRRDRSTIYLLLWIAIPSSSSRSRNPKDRSTSCR